MSAESWLLKIRVGCQNSDHEKHGTHRRVGIQIQQKREGRCLFLVHKMKWLRSPLPCHIMKQSRLLKLPTTKTRRRSCKQADSAGTRRVSQSEAKGNQQFPSTRSSGGSYEIWIAMQKFDADALGVITRKPDDSLKARLVIQGFTDPQLGAKPTASPTVSRRGRQLFLTVAGSFRMKVFQGRRKNSFFARISWRSGAAFVNRLPSWRKRWDWSIISV